MTAFSDFSANYRRTFYAFMNSSCTLQEDVTRHRADSQWSHHEAAMSASYRR